MEDRAHGSPDPEETRARLARVGPGLSEELLHAVVRAGRYARQRATALHPPLTGPFNAYSDATYTLRVQLWPHGWKPCNKNGYPRTVSADRKVGIAVASGDENTGVDGVFPTTTSTKGACTERAVLRNQRTLFEDLAPADREAWEGPGSSAAGKDERTWILLVHDAEDETRIELSLPNDYDEGAKRPTGWADRIILRPLPHDDNTDDHDSGPDGGLDFDVPVTRRAG